MEALDKKRILYYCLKQKIELNLITSEAVNPPGNASWIGVLRS
jgi:hypothetical protein